MTFDAAPENLMFGDGKDADVLFVADGSNIQACQTACADAGDACAGWSVSTAGKGKKAKTECNLFASISESKEDKRMKGFRSCTADELLAFETRGDLPENDDEKKEKPAPKGDDDEKKAPKDDDEKKEKPAP